MAQTPEDEFEEMTEEQAEDLRRYREQRAAMTPEEIKAEVMAALDAGLEAYYRIFPEAKEAGDDDF